MLGNYKKFYCNCRAISSLAILLLLSQVTIAFANGEYTRKMWAYLESTWKDVPDSVAKFIYYNADVNAEHDPGQRSGMTPLLFAANKGYVNIAKTLIKHGADVNAVDFQGRTALMYAAQNGDVDMIKVLLNADADIRIPDDQEQNALHFAVQACHLQAMQVLLQHNARINKRDVAGRSALMKACSNGSESIVTLLLSYGANYDFIDNNGETAMIYAIRADAVPVVKALIQSGFDINTENIYGSTYIAAAVMLNRNDICKFMLDAQADPNTVISMEPHHGLPILIYALNMQNFQLADELLAHHADVNKQHPSGWTALMTAAMFGNLEYIEKLCERGAQIDAVIIGPENIGQTALICAVLNNNYLAAKALADRGLDINHKDASGRTALDYALQNGNIEIVQILINKGAESSISKYTLAERQ